MVLFELSRLSGFLIEADIRLPAGQLRFDDQSYRGGGVQPESASSDYWRFLMDILPAVKTHVALAVAVLIQKEATIVVGDFRRVGAVLRRPGRRQDARHAQQHQGNGDTQQYRRRLTGKQIGLGRH